jgi:hypothetical protein
MALRRSRRSATVAGGPFTVQPSIESEGGTMSTKKRWRKPPPTKPRPEDRFWRRAPGGLVGWSGRVLQPDQQMRERRPDDESISRVLRTFPSEINLQADKPPVGSDEERTSKAR